MPRKPAGQILEHTARNGVVSYGVRFRGRGYPAEVIHLGRSDEGMNRARAEHEARLIASQILAGTWTPPLKADYVESEVPTIAQLADEHYQRKVRKGLRPNSLADMRRKLEIHLLPHFGGHHRERTDEPRCRGLPGPQARREPPDRGRPCDW